MQSARRQGNPEQRGESASGGLPDGEALGGWGDWGESVAAERQDPFWDAFELDDEREDPLPEYGDFWPEPDDEAI